MIILSQAAAQEIKRLKLIRQQSDSRLRLQIKPGGCSGLYYDLNLDPPSEDQIEVNDAVYESNGILIYIDSQSHIYVDELKIDYSEDLMGGGFRFQNQRAIEPCSCGLSFKEIAAS